MKFIMEDGKFLCKEENITNSTLTGTLIGIRVLTSEDGPKKLQLDFRKDEDNVDTLTLKLYADPALKILRCLYGVAEIIHNMIITIELVPREGRSSLIKVSADGENLDPCGRVDDYANDKMFFTDKCVKILKYCLSFCHTVLVYANTDKNYPDGNNIQAITDYIRELRRNGRTNELTVKKTVLCLPSAAKGYMKAIRDVPQSGFRVFTEPQAIDAIWKAFTEELEAPETLEDPTTVGDGDREV